MSELDLPDAVAAVCRRETDAMLERIEELVRINSFSRAPEGGARTASVLARELGAIDGVTVALEESPDFAPHVVAHMAAEHAADCVGLVGHHDTVFPPGTFEGFRIDGGIARGPGVLDMKSGLVTAITAMRILSAHGARVPIRLVIVSDEEIGSPEGGSILTRELTGASCALVFEAGRAHDAIITARKGTGGVTVKSRGEQGIAGLATFIDQAQRLTDYDRGVTVNVGTVETDGDVATAVFDLRFLSTPDGERLAGTFRELAASLGDHLTVTGGVSRPPLERSEDNVTLFREYAGCAALSGLGSAEAKLIGGGSDASTTAAIGIPSIDGLGPRGTGFHTKDELIEIATLPQRLEALVRFLWARQI